MLSCPIGRTIENQSINNFLKSQFYRACMNSEGTKASPFPRSNRILIVEDDPDTIKILRLYFIKEKFEVDVAGDGEEGLSILRQHHHDIVLSDVMMPKMDGYKLCEAIRSDDTIKMTPIVLVTAKVELSDKLTGLEKGADAYLTKPYNLTELRAQIASLLKLRELRLALTNREKEIERIRTLEQTLIAISHHINNAIAPISGRAQLTDPADVEQVRKLIDVASIGCRRISRTINLLSDVVSAMKQASNDQAFDLNKTTINELLEKFKSNGDTDLQ